MYSCIYNIFKYILNYEKSMTDDPRLEKIENYLNSFRDNSPQQNRGISKTNKPENVFHCPILKRVTGDGEIRVPSYDDVACEFYTHFDSDFSRCLVKEGVGADHASSQCPYRNARIYSIKSDECPALRRKTGNGEIKIIDSIVACEFFASFKEEDNTCYAKVEQGGDKSTSTCPYSNLSSVYENNRWKMEKMEKKKRGW